MDRIIHIVDTGVANMSSIEAGFQRQGRSVVRSVDPDVIATATAVVLPGVGSFAAGIDAIDRNDLRAAIIDRFDADRSTLAICLGLQMLCRGSAEASGVIGLGVIDADVEAMPPAAVRPQMGWNRIEASGGPVLESGDAYFANGFALRTAPADWNVSWSDDEGAFIAGLERGRTIACQFHPEISGRFGAGILARWTEAAFEAEVSTCV